MPVINYLTKVITVSRAEMPLITASPEVRRLDMNNFRLALKNLEDSPEGMAYPDTHRHNTTVVLSGVSYARVIEIINGYTVTFEEGPSAYTIVCEGANHNLADVKNVNNVSLVVGNSAGLVEVSTPALGPTAEQITAAVIAALNATTIPVDMRKVKGQTIGGTGTGSDPWGPG